VVADIYPTLVTNVEPCDRNTAYDIKHKYRGQPYQQKYKPLLSGIRVAKKKRDVEYIQLQRVAWVGYTYYPSSAYGYDRFKMAQH